MFLVSSCSCLCPIHWSQVLSREWRFSFSSADRRCSNYIWVINSFIAYLAATNITGLTAFIWISSLLLKQLYDCPSGREDEMKTDQPKNRMSANHVYNSWNILHSYSRVFTDYWYYYTFIIFCVFTSVLYQVRRLGLVEKLSTEEKMLQEVSMYQPM